jgi:hypothetical protein
MHGFVSALWEGKVGTVRIDAAPAPLVHLGALLCSFRPLVGSRTRQTFALGCQSHWRSGQDRAGAPTSSSTRPAKALSCRPARPRHRHRGVALPPDRGTVRGGCHRRRQRRVRDGKPSPTAAV